MARIDRASRLEILTQTDKPLWTQDILFAGIDEAGRGPLCGNVVAACVAMPASPLLPWVDDSKKLSEKRRAQVYEEIMQTALFVGVGEAAPDEIDEINILEADKNAMRRAAQYVPAELYLVDAVRGLNLGAPEQALIHGDALCYAIAAASIVAKVTRDREMLELDALYPEYGFASNKGYGTPQHIAALKKYGPCPAHRKSFIGHFWP